MSYVKNKLSFIKSIYKEKCPHCGVGHVFEKGLSTFKIPIMKERCSKCDYRFEREPGYFIGAMYLSYGLAIFQGVIAFIICNILSSGLTIEWIVAAVVLPMILMSKKNFKWSRILYIHIFPW